MSDFAQFACDNCGACCRALIVEATYVDAMREPRLYEIAPDIDRAEFRAGERCIMLWDAETRGCPFLIDAPDHATHACDIYQTRPQECVGVEPGDAKCQQAREVKRLPILRDRDGKPPSREQMEASAEFYELDWLPYEDEYTKGGA